MVTIVLSIALHELQTKLQLLKMHTNITSFIECILQCEIQLVQCHVLIVSFLIQAFLFDFSWEEYRSQHYKLK